MCGKTQEQKMMNSYMGEISKSTMDPTCLNSFGNISAIINENIGPNGISQAQKKLRSNRSTNNLNVENCQQNPYYRNSQISYKKNEKKENSIKSAKHNGMLQNNSIQYEKISKAELRLLREYLLINVKFISCQEMVDNASRIECQNCFEVLSPDSFYEHVKERSCEKREKPEFSNKSFQFNELYSSQDPHNPFDPKCYKEEVKKRLIKIHLDHGFDGRKKRTRNKVESDKGWIRVYEFKNP